MKKIICDKCKEEIKLGECTDGVFIATTLRNIKRVPFAEDVPSLTVKIERADLCSKCSWEELLRVVDNKKSESK